jgi:hypothetical protein
MATPSKRPWTVTPHTTIEKLDDNLWAVESPVPGVPIQRRMCIAKMGDGSLVFSHAIPLDEKSLAEVVAWGRPSYQVVAHHQHVIDGDAFREKLGLKAYGPKECDAQVRARIELAGNLDKFPTDGAVSVEPVPGAKLGEPVVIVKSGNGARVSLIFADVIQNNAKESTKPLFRLLGFAGGPKVVPAFRMLFVKEKAALKAALARWAALPGLTRIIPCHGTIVSHDAPAALRAAADAL